MKLYLIDNASFEIHIQEVLKIHFGFDARTSNAIYQKQIKKNILQLKPTINFLVESVYVDKIYRDSYYKYYSTKLRGYSRNCIKLSLFEGVLEHDDFNNQEKIEALKDKYRGFIILRPLKSALVGRSAISPEALSNNAFKTCLSFIPCTANSLKFDVQAFPHSSQDSETISCAETTIWAIMEYYGNKYPEYRPVLPSTILNTLKDLTNERQLPTIGLQIHQISFALRNFGLETKIYSLDNYGRDFHSIISTYIESGIPLIISVDNERANRILPEGKKFTSIGHAMICAGRENIENHMINSLCTNPLSLPELQKASIENNIKIYDVDNMNKRFIFIDDNFPVYQKQFLNTPTNHYPTPSWNACNVSHVIVPLPKKVYLEAYKAKNFALSLLLLIDGFKLDSDEEVVIRTFLSSSRSYKQYVMNNTELTSDLKTYITETPMSKFIWAVELSNKTLFESERSMNGLILIDATEPEMTDLQPLILAVKKDTMLKYKNELNKFEKIKVPLQKFKFFDRNLK